MTLNQVYEHFGKNWARCMRECEFSPFAYRYWIDKEAIPFGAQCKIENKTHGVLKAKKEHKSAFDEKLKRVKL